MSELWVKYREMTKLCAKFDGYQLRQLIIFELYYIFTDEGKKRR